jgi:anti-sigma factor RsiW
MSPTFIMTPDASHPSDGLLVALIDGETQSDAAIDRHVAQCHTCASRVAQLRQLDSRVSAAVTRIAIPTFDAAAMRTRLAQANAKRPRPVVGWMPRAARIAAAIVLVAGAAWASPAREWVVRRLAPVEPSSDAPKAARPAAPAPAVAGMVVRFAPVGDELVVRLAARPDDGMLEVQAASGDQVSARITRGGANEEMLVLPGELRILNSAQSTADYRVSVPSGVARVRIVVAGEERRVIPIVPTTHATITLGRP